MNDEKSIYGIIGYPVSHSLSPLLHNTAFQELNINADYRLFPLKENELEGFLKELRNEKSPIFGLNVTVPYKEKVINFLDNLSPYAQKAMAVNTIIVTSKRKLQGNNTDGPGFLTHLAELKFEIEGKRIAILGAGGTARAIITALCLILERPSVIKIYNRNKDRADNLIYDLSQRMDVGVLESVVTIDELDIKETDLLINTTPVGMKGEDACLIDEDLLHSRLLVYDVIYEPFETPLLRFAKKKGARVANGLGMLFYQGVLAFQHWANVQLASEIKSKMKKALFSAVEK